MKQQGSRHCGAVVMQSAASMCCWCLPACLLVGARSAQQDVHTCRCRDLPEVALHQLPHIPYLQAAKAANKLSCGRRPARPCSMHFTSNLFNPSSLPGR